eukprot:scaffold2357_cov399-Prasinococcus_capsulatus_cf.AAC.14
MPPRIAWTCPSREVPAPNGMRGMRFSAQSLTTCDTSSVEPGITTRCGSLLCGNKTCNNLRPRFRGFDAEKRMLQSVRFLSEVRTCLVPGLVLSMPLEFCRSTGQV